MDVMVAHLKAGPSDPSTSSGQAFTALRSGDESMSGFDTGISASE